MQAGKLQHASRQVATLLEKSNVLTNIRQCRESTGEARQQALQQLGQTAGLLVGKIGQLDGDARALLDTMHLSSLSKKPYWQSLLSSQTNENVRQAELVRLYSRIMFAASHLPSLVGLLDNLEPNTDAAALAVGVRAGEARLTVRLADAGEKASDPDRIARAIDGIDMLYSASASLARKSSIDLNLVGISGSATRDLTFVGEDDSIAMVQEIVSQIPSVVASINPNEEADIHSLVLSMPIFKTIAEVGEQGQIDKPDLKDIHDTMHQGVLLTLESGVLLLSSPAKSSQASNGEPIVPTLKTRLNASDGDQPAQGQPDRPARGAGDPESAKKLQDEYFEQYLAEKEKLGRGDG